MKDIVGHIVVSGQIRHFILVYKLFDCAVDAALPSRKPIVPELNLVILCEVEQDDTLAHGQVEGLHFQGREHALDHKTRNFHRVALGSLVESVHDQEGRRLECRAEDLGVLFCVMHKFDHVSGQSIVVNPEAERGSARVLNDAQVVGQLGLSEHHHVRHAKSTGRSHKVFNRIAR